MPDLSDEPSRGMFWAGWVLTLVPGLFLLLGGFTALSGAARVVQGMAPFGYPPGIFPILGAVELLCSALYLVPRTATVGVILMTGYFGGAVATHVRIGDPKWVYPVLFGVIAWAGLLLRRPGLRRAMLGV